MRGFGLSNSRGKSIAFPHSHAFRPSKNPRRFSTAKIQAQQSGSDPNKQRQPWDFGRFLQTVLFFNPPPSPGKIIAAPFRMVSSILTPPMQSTNNNNDDALITLLGAPPTSTAPRNAVLVTGATGGVGRRVVSLLLSRPNTHVIALVRDIQKAKTFFGTARAAPGACLQLIPADISQSKTLIPAAFDRVDRMIWCSATTVAPKEGDTADRSKYYQGIKFYDPEIKGDTPEAVEYKGMLNIVEVLKNRLPLEKGLPIYVPGEISSSPVKEWGPVDDVVMGGVSSSALAVQQRSSNIEATGAVSSTGVFAGMVTTANNGGFASVRSRTIQPPLDASRYAGIELRVCGDGQRYKCILRTESAWDGVGYTVSFDTSSTGDWETIRLPFEAFVPVFRARTMKDSPALDVGSICSVQLMLSKFEYDGGLNPKFKEGNFELQVERITAYVKEPITPRVVMVSSAGVTRPSRPGINVDQEPPAVKLNDMLGGLLTYKLAGEDVLRSSRVPFAVVRPTALTEEPAGAELVVDQGDTIKGKISRDDVAELCVALLNEPCATDMTFEIKSTVPFSTPFTVDGDVPKRDWKELLVGAGLKKGVTGKTVNGVYTGKEPEDVVLEKAGSV